ncbi:hypothetical protein MKW92_010626 [Papaver armeniacum]|nr:hypothetical protein MKW92_010626 [Papaver armeniacum]
MLAIVNQKGVRVRSFIYLPLGLHHTNLRVQFGLRMDRMSTNKQAHYCKKQTIGFDCYKSIILTTGSLFHITHIEGKGEDIFLFKRLFYINKSKEENQKSKEWSLTGTGVSRVPRR